MFVNTGIFISQPQTLYLNVHSCVSSSMNFWNHNKNVVLSLAKGSFYFTGCYVGIARMKKAWKI